MIISEIPSKTGPWIDLGSYWQQSRTIVAMRKSHFVIFIKLITLSLVTVQLQLSQL